MNQAQARNYARKRTMGATFIVLALLLFLSFLGEVKGDFPNGLLLFLGAVINVHFLAILAIIFTLTFVFSGMAGREIILQQRKFPPVALKYALLITLAACAYIILISLQGMGSFSLKLQAGVLLKRLLPFFLRTLILLSAVWLWAAYSMKSATPKARP